MRTIDEVCQDEHLTYPETEQELITFIRVCDERGIVTNVSGERWWRDLRFARFCPNHPDRRAASPSSNLCGPCLMGHEVKP